MLRIEAEITPKSLASGARSMQQNPEKKIPNRIVTSQLYLWGPMAEYVCAYFLACVLVFL
jgi:hypothetical protein